jgi:hypothetical protein
LCQNGWCEGHHQYIDEVVDDCEFWVEHVEETIATTISKRKGKKIPSKKPMEWDNESNY